MKINIIENHDEALQIWSQANMSKVSLYHFDAHIDFAAIRRSEEINIGNFIYEAISKGIINQFIWIIPLPSFNNKAIMKEIICKINSYLCNNIYCCDDGTYKGKIKANDVMIEFIICSILHVQNLIAQNNSEYIIDIDIDFFVNPLIDVITYSHVFRYCLWIQPEDFACVLSSINPSSCITICRSIIGGFTPLRYGFFAEMLRDILLKKRIKYFQNMIIAIEEFDKENYELAISSYQTCMCNKELALYATFGLFEIAILMQDHILYNKVCSSIKESFLLRYILNIEQLMYMKQNKQVYKLLKKWSKIDKNNTDLNLLWLKWSLQRGGKRIKGCLPKKNDSETKYYIGCSMYLMKNYTEAISYLDQSLKELSEGYFYWEEVFTSNQKIQLITPIKLKIYNMLADSYYKIGEYQYAYRYYSLLARLGGNPLQFKYFIKVAKKLKKSITIKKYCIHERIKQIMYLNRSKTLEVKVYKQLYIFWEANFEIYRKFNL